jgi:hypothetical protein
MGQQEIDAEDQTVRRSMISQIGMDIRKTIKPFCIIRLEQYRCRKYFADICEDEIVFAGLDKNCGGMIISNDRWRDSIIGVNLFYEHFDPEPEWFPENVDDKSVSMWLKVYKSLPKKIFYK